MPQIKLTPSEVKDINRALVIAMQTLDNSGGTNDKKLANRIEELIKKFQQ